MRLNTDTPVPENVTATVKSVSAVGEQYIDLVPPAGRLERDAARRVGHRRRTTPPIGQDIAGLLTQADELVNSIGNSRLQDLLRETFKAFNGSGPELARLIQSSRLLVDEANANYGQTTQLIDQAGPFLDAQIRSGDDIKSLADGLARFTTEAAKRRPAAARRCCRRCPAPRRRPTPRSTASGRSSRCWPPTWPTSAASA